MNIFTRHLLATVIALLVFSPALLAQCNAGLSASYNSGSGNITAVSTSSGASSFTWDVWDPNQGYSTYNGPQVTIPANAPGSWFICINAFDTLGNWCDTACTSVMVQGGAPVCNAALSASYNSFSNTISATHSSSGGVFYDWLVFDPNQGSNTYTGQSINFSTPTPGTYSVCVMAYDSAGLVCDSACQNVLVGQNPSNCTAVFTSSVQGNTLSVNNTSSSSGGGLFYSWDFGDGGTAFSQNPTHTYNSNGNYLVCLTISDSSGCTDTACDTITVSGTGASCQASFSSGAQGSFVSFTNTSTSSSGGLFYSWDFGDGGTAFSQHPTHSYNSNGTYVVCLTISDSSGCSDTHCDTLTVSGTTGNCQASFTASSQGNSAFFTNTSTSPTGNLSYVWDFGDGSSSTQTNPQHTYNSSGTYTVCLTISDSNNCSGTFCDTISVGSTGGTCAASFTTTTQGNFLVLTNTSSSPSGGLSYVWDFGDGNTSTMQHPTHNYAQGGTYIVCLTISDSVGCSDTVCDTVTVGNTTGCQAFFTPSVQGNMLSVSNGSQGTNLSYIWDFGDGNTATGISPTHTYAQDGSYLVCLTISSGAICQDTYCDSVVIATTTGNCSAAFTQSTNGLMVDFDANASQGVLYAWNFGDGGSTTPASAGNVTISHTYAAAGTYTVTLFVSDNSIGCTDSTTNVVTVSDTTSSIFGPGTSVGEATVFPNPITGNATVLLTSQNVGNVVVAVYNALGKRMLQQSASVAAGQASIALPTEALPAGVYFVNMASDTGIQLTKRVLKTN